MTPTTFSAFFRGKILRHRSHLQIYSAAATKTSIPNAGFCITAQMESYSRRGNPSTTEQRRQKMPRLYHSKSRTGCTRCRARRVKCDEAKPLCKNCNRHGVSCIYENMAKNLSKNPIQNPGSEGLKSNTDLLQEYKVGSSSRPILDLDDEFSQEMIYSSEFDCSGISDVPESKSRRLLELRLLQNWIDKTSKQFGACHYEDIRHAWSVEVPKLALQHDNLLYQILSISALHVLKTEPKNSELIFARQTYQGLALRDHRRAVAKLSSKNADVVCCASSLVCIDAFASLQERPIEPYSPPMEWLHMARGAGSVFAVGIDKLKDSKKFEASTIMAISSRHPYFDDGNLLFEEMNRKSLLRLLTQDIPGDLWDQETQQAYEKALSYIGWVQAAIKDGEHVLGSCRRMMAFPILAPKKFVDFVHEMRPRALVILAHFFALGSQLGDIWWIGGTIQREIQAIQRILPSEWQPLMRQPLMRAGLTTM